MGGVVGAGRGWPEVAEMEADGSGPSAQSDAQERMALGS